MQTFVREPPPADPDEPADPAQRCRGSAVHPPHAHSAGCDRPRSVRRAVRWGGGVDAGDRRGRLGVGDVAYGWLRAAPGFGAAAMALALAARPVRRHVGVTLLVAVGVFGVGTVVLGVTHIYVVAFLALVVLSAADMISVFIRGSLVPLVTPDEKRGRVLAVESVFIGASNELGAFESGMVAQAIGAPATIVVGGVGTLAVVGVWWFAFPSLRTIDRFEDLEIEKSDSTEPR